MRQNMVKPGFLMMILILSITTSCSASTSGIVDETGAALQVEDEKVDPQPEPIQEATVEVLPDAFIEMEFTTTDGRTLQGTYFPASVSPAPLVIMMHWAPGDQSDMRELAYWLQNRGFSDSQSNDFSGKPWLDPSWFPQLEKERSYAVFTFTFDGCEGGCKSFERAEWLLDAQAAVEAAYGLEGIDPTRIVTLGASIGADGAADGCAHINTLHPGSCRGAFSLSPGDYLTLNYADVVEKLHATASPVITYCLFAAGDAESATACQSVPSSDASEVIGYGSDLHGLMLVQPNLEHDTMALMVEFLNATIEKK